MTLRTARSSSALACASLSVPIGFIPAANNRLVVASDSKGADRRVEPRADCSALTLPVSLPSNGNAQAGQIVAFSVIRRPHCGQGFVTICTVLAVCRGSPVVVGTAAGALPPCL